MPIDPPHRKTVRHWHEAGHAHRLTFSCVGRRNLLVRDDFCEMLARSIDAAHRRHGFELIAFVSMPNHVHLLVWPPADGGRIDKLLYAIKRPFSFRVKQLLSAERSPLLHNLTIRERPGKTTFRFWQEGPGYDRNVFSRDAIVHAIDYIHQNPVRRELCALPEQWRWSSYRRYEFPERPTDPALPEVHGVPDF